MIGGKRKAMNESGVQADSPMQEQEVVFIAC